MISTARVYGLAGVLGILMGMPGAAVPASAQTPREYVLTGRVLDQTSQNPIVGAALLLRTPERQAVTDSAGRFRIAGLGAGSYLLRISHIAYGDREVAILVSTAPVTEVELRVSATAIALAPVEASALSREERNSRAAGYRAGRITRAEIALTENTNMLLSDVLQQKLPNVRVRRLERVVGDLICVELRSIRVLDARGACLSPKLYLDGVPITNPTTFWGNIDVNNVEAVEVIPAAEAGTRFGMGAQYGAILIETRRPGSEQTNRVSAPKRLSRSYFDWSRDPAGHRTKRVFATAFAANAVALSLANLAARECLHLRQPGNDALVSDCAFLPSLALAASTVLVPAIGTSMATRAMGRTPRSAGRLAPSVLVASMALVPGIGFVVASKRAQSEALQAAGYTILLVGVPFLTTAADYLFRNATDIKE